MTADRLHDDEINVANGCRLRIRSLRHGEENVVRELYARLSPRTRYFRFFSEMPVMPDSLVRMLADVDDVQRVALVVEADSTCGGDVVALGNLAMNEDYAEIGIVVADAWQRKGLGTVLATAMLHVGEFRGYHKFLAHCLWDNHGMRRLLNRIGDIVSTSTKSGVLEITFRRRKLVKDPLVQAYERILAAGGRGTARR